MRRLFLSLAILLAGVGLVNAQDMPDKPLLFAISNYANGNVWFNDDLQGVSFELAEETDWDTGERSTTLKFDYYHTLSNGARWGWVNCKVPNNSVSATQARATFNVQISDPSVDCVGQIAELIDGIPSPLAPWTYPIEVTGSMSNPNNVSTQNGTMTEADYALGTSLRYSCLASGAYNLNGGGFSVLIPETEDFRYFAFSTNGEDPDAASGSYASDDCRLLIKPPKK